MVIGFHKNPEYFKAYTNGEYFDHISIYCSYLDHVGKQFTAGKDKATVMAELIELHLPQNLAASMAKVAAIRAKKKSDGEHTVATSTDQKEREIVGDPLYTHKPNDSERLIAEVILYAKPEPYKNSWYMEEL